MAPEKVVKEVDVVIVGGGFAGLSAALKINDYNQSHNGDAISYVVLETHKQIGGRTLMRINKRDDGRLDDGWDKDYGGGYVGASQHHIQFLLRRFRVQTVKSYLARTKQWQFQYADPKRPIDRFPGDDPLAFPGGLNGQIVLAKLDSLSLEVRACFPEPWKHRLAAQLDAITVQDWIDSKRQEWEDNNAGKPPEQVDPTKGMSADTEEAFVVSVRSAFSLEPREISMFFFIHYAACAGSFAALVDVTGGEGAAEGTRMMFGTKTLLDNMVNDPSQGIGADNVVLGARIAELRQEGDAVQVMTQSREIYRGKYAIVAMSPPQANRISYLPELETYGGGSDRVALCSAMDGCLGRTIKGFLCFKPEPDPRNENSRPLDPFWRRKRSIRLPGLGLMGFVLSAGPKETCPVDWTLDNVWDPSDDHFKNRFGKLIPKLKQPPNPIHALMTFIVGDSAAYWSQKSFDERARAVIEQLKVVFDNFNGLGDDALLDKNDLRKTYFEENWVPRGIEERLPAPGAMMPVKTLTAYGPALTKPIGRIHWAGSESSQEWCGYMNGAIESGFRASGEVLERLRP